MALLKRHSPFSPVFYNLGHFIFATSHTAPTTGFPLYGNPTATEDANQNCIPIVCHSFLFLGRSLASLASILLSFRAHFTPSIHPNLGLPQALLPSTFTFITFFSSHSLSILSYIVYILIGVRIKLSNRLYRKIQDTQYLHH